MCWPATGLVAIRAICAGVFWLCLVAVSVAQTGSAETDAPAARSSDLDPIAWGLTASGVDFELGRGITQNYGEAARLYHRAAERGYAPAQNSLARLYDLGTGVRQDEVRAYMWYTLAAEHGHTTAATDRDHLARRMTPEQRAGAERLVREWRSGQE